MEVLEEVAQISESPTQPEAEKKKRGRPTKKEQEERQKAQEAASQSKAASSNSTAAALAGALNGKKDSDGDEDNPDKRPPQPPPPPSGPSARGEPSPERSEPCSCCKPSFARIFDWMRRADMELLDLNRNYSYLTRTAAASPERGRVNAPPAHHEEYELRKQIE